MPNDEHAIRESVTIDHVLEVLNRLLATDPVATRDLVLLARVPCNDDLAKDPTIQVRGYKVNDDDPAYSVGIIGIINGFFGVDEGGWGPITANVKLVCSEGCEIPEGVPLQIGGMCPLCAEKEVSQDEKGRILFGPIEKFVRTQPPDKRRAGSP